MTTVSALPDTDAHVITEQRNWDNLTEAVRLEMTRQNITAAQVDLSKPLEARFQKQAQKQAVHLGSPK
jgi:hypothetical protein